MESQYPFEKLGLFYLGRELDVRTGESLPVPLLYKSKDMTTHGVMIGMTGSGKTGLGIGLIEEAAIDNIPSIVIDPKGDMGNLLLTFPECQARDFAPWVDAADAARKNLSVEAFAEQTAKTWKDGLASWGQGLDRIAALKSKTRMTIYTPGSSAGVGISVLSSFAAPSTEVLADIDTLNSLVNSSVTSLLALINISGDPMQSKEHILLSSLFLHSWRNGEDLTMESLIGYVVNPPFAKVGVFALDTFYPQTERMVLAMNLNNILASPSFSAWTQGVPLDIQRLLYTEDGLPCTAIFSISHLSDTERMFFVTMLLNRFIGWMRRQQGASSLRALLYMDEIYGYFPPTANPPSKKPMMLLLKQARAFGVGVVLATQNPVDLDYKGLGNIGTWFIGRLQTRQDQERVLDGIVGASEGGFDTATVKKMLSNMKGRQFLLKSAHLDEPLLFETRWVMSYLKGPISTNDIKKLMKSQQSVAGGDSSGDVSGRQAGPTASNGEPSGLPPVLPPSIEQRYHLQNVVRDQVSFEPWLVGNASVRYFNTKRNIDEVSEVKLRCYLDESFLRPDWDGAEDFDFALDDCAGEPPAGASFHSLPAELTNLRDFRTLEKHFSDYLYQNRRLELYRVKNSDFESEPGESLGDFRVRFGNSLREQKEDAVEKLRAKYQGTQERLERKLDTAQDQLDKEKVDVRSKTTDSLISFGVAVVGAFLGRKALSASTIGRAATGVRGIGRVAKEKSDVQRAEDNVEELQQQLAALSEEIEVKIDEVADAYTIDNYEIETFSYKPKRSDIFNQLHVTYPIHRG